MDLQSIEKQANSVLKNYEELTKTNIGPPIPIDAIAKVYYGFVTLEEEFDEDISGKLFLKDKIIILNSVDPKVRQRFTIAHELGHIQLHTKEINGDIIVSRKSDTGRLDKEANMFAANLLMPKRLLYEYVIKKIIDAGEDLSWLLDMLKHLPDSNLKAINQLLFSAAFEDSNMEFLLSIISNTAKVFKVSKDALSWRLKDFGLLNKLFK